jgi:hypothetical protein
MLKSLVDVTPIIFVKIGQDQVGTVDFRLITASPKTALSDANRNFYATDPWNNPINALLENNQQSLTNLTEEGHGKVNSMPEIKVLDDSVTIAGFPVMRNKYYQEKLGKLNRFEGFVPRWTFPRTVIEVAEKSPPVSTTQMLLVIDTAREVFIGMGEKFPPTVLH